MPDVSAILALPYIQPSQAQKHVTHNEALRRLDILVQLGVAGFGAEAPPAAPEEGEVHALGASPTGAWSGQAGMIAARADGAWHFIAPQEGWRAWGRAEQELRVWTGSDWTGLQAETDHLAGVGIGTAADEINRLAVKAEATLLSHDGAGHQLKINKAGAGETASVLFQSNWSGRAEIGLSGEDDFTVKLSEDGTAWVQAMTVTADGKLGIGTGAPDTTAHVRNTGASGGGADVLKLEATHASYARNLTLSRTVRAGSSDFDFLRCQSDGGADTEIVLTGDGNGRCDGAWTGGGADYAEYFEWADGNPGAQDRRGVSVVLDGDKIRPARDGEEPIGVISGNPSVVGDGDMDRWKGKYLRDDFGSYVWEVHEVVAWTEEGEDTGPVQHSYAADAVPDGLAVPADAVRTPQMRRRTNPDYDPAHPYVPRAERPEWDMVGLMGKLRLRKGQPTSARWIRMRDVSGEVEEWLVR